MVRLTLKLGQILFYNSPNYTYFTLALLTFMNPSVSILMFYLIFRICAGLVSLFAREAMRTAFDVEIFFVFIAG